MHIKNIDEQGNEILDIDWSKWERIQTEEVLDDDGKLSHIVSHCKKISDDDIALKDIFECEECLKTSDIDIVRASESLIESFTNAKSLTDLLTSFKKVYENYEEIIEKRKEWRNRINELKNKQ